LRITADNNDYEKVLGMSTGKKLISSSQILHPIVPALGDQVCQELILFHHAKRQIMSRLRIYESAKCFLLCLLTSYTSCLTELNDLL
jgi:hypothetical protein